MSTKIIYAFIFLLCLKIQVIGQNSQNTFSIIQDGIIPKLKNCDTSNSLVNEYYSYLGIKFSKYYIILDSLKIDINKDGFLDRFLVIAPITQIYSPDTLPCDQQTGKKLAVVLLAQQNKYTISYVNENLILNDYEFQSEPYCGIKSCNHGFILCFFIGSIIKCEYNFYFKIKNGNLYLYKRKYDCYVTDLSSNAKQTKKHPFSKETNLSSINTRNFIDIPDLLKNKN
ncbi:MAG: hypothetical protein A3F91_03685 [Flavobacteria bacterium RIFCSPLOWO2_12_FULL_35_11]|nr:MAG: hypothetical protein A3F91_03685 [Flavobacteria bacterium RIFCSPLOWO2_12_FULL_35_11]